MRVAFDLGAESGRALVGRFDGTRARPGGGAPVPEPAGPASRRPLLGLLGLFAEICSALGRARRGRHRVRSVGIDSWGCDFGLLDPAGHPDLESAASSRRPGAGGMERAFARVPMPRRSTRQRESSSCRSTPPSSCSLSSRAWPCNRAETLLLIPGPARLLADRRALRRGDEREHDPAPRRRDGPLVGQPDLKARHPRAALRGRAIEPGETAGGLLCQQEPAPACRPGHR